ncbi:conserved hypothetical protein [Theileria orientalis strain Shintoku]|uniref:Uncharacterized protein n=1 Tax=Theileria orientalis strain Shintoku TaxID=869250 RepID=J4C8K8_THEOR|nr:conserved hypothetical protein [Theileria orientalis strain Shintoku]BAM40963.1 conserved hypothetical protein [Theileria orientalis strain Shintoku]|eukprot:XP_009691264.1 conserved hypothetical protein [Theileria orientalis strain Shintoku]
MKILYLFFIITQLVSSVYAVDKTEPEYPQSLLSFNSPLREVSLRWEYAQFGKTFNRNTGFITSIEQEKLLYSKNGSQVEYNKLKEKLNSGILPEFLPTSKIVPFILKADGTRLIETVKEVPEINTIEELRDFLLKNNIDRSNYKTISNGFNLDFLKNKNQFKKNMFNYECIHYNTSTVNEKLFGNYINSINTNTNLNVNECNYEWIKSCKDAYELVKIVNHIGTLSKEESESIRLRAIEIISTDMKQNSILLITLTQFGIDAKPFVEKLSDIEITNNEHIVLRALSESKLKPEEYCNKLKEKLNIIYYNYFKLFNDNNSIVDVNGDKFGADHKVKFMEKYNYICSYCKFISKNVLNNIGHINVVESYINRFKDNEGNELNYYTVQQLVDICYHLALVNSDTCKILIDKLHKMNFYKKVHYSELIQMFTKVAHFDEKNRFENVERLLLENYKNESFTLGIDDCVNILIAIGRSRKCGVILIDRVVDDIKNYTNELELYHISKILINLSKVNYNNRGFIRQMVNMILTFVDEDSIVDPFTISNTLKSLGRFNYYNEKLIKILLTIMEKEEVLAEFKLHDIVTIFSSICKIVSSNFVNNSKININRYLRILANKICTSDINTETSIKLINASGRILYNNERFLNTIIESINLNEKLKINCDKLSLFYPELSRRIEELERRLRPVSDEAVQSCDKSEENSISVYVRRNIMYRDLKLPSVRKRKWTY